MHNFTLFISGLLSILITPPSKRTVVEYQDRLDPRGLVYTDIKFLKGLLPERGWSKGKTLEEVAYEQGQHALIKLIETRVIGRRLDGQPTTISS